MMRRVSLVVLPILLVVSLLTGPTWAGPNVWTEHGPPGGAIRSVLVVPGGDPSLDTIYVGTIGSGVFKSTNGGATWVQKGLFDGFTVRALVRDAALGTIYAGVENEPGAPSGGVFSSINGGDTWISLDNGLTNKKVQSLALDGSTLYAGTREEGSIPNVVSGGVFMWDGALWHQMNSGLLPGSGECNSCPRRVQALATDSRTPGTIYAGTQGSGVYKSINGGATWTRWPNLDTTQGWRSDCLHNPEIQALLVDETQLQETLYAGATGKVGNSGCNPLPPSGDKGQGPGFFRFKNGEWDRKMNGMQDLLPTLTLNVWALAISGDRVYMGSDIGVLTSDDQAQSWDGVPSLGPPPLPSGLLGPVRALAGHPSGTTTILYAGTSGRGMFKRSNTATNAIGNHAWTEVNTGLTALRALSVAVANQAGGSTILAGISGGGIIRSTDGGTNWLNTSEKERSVLGIVVDPSDPSTAYAATGRGVYKSEDSGATWTPVNAGLPTEVVPEIQAGSDAAVGPFTLPRTVRTIAADLVNPGVLYAAVQGVYTSVDGGANWVSLNGNLPTTVTSGDGTVSAIVVNHGPGSNPVWGDLYLASDGIGVGAAGVFRSTDGGLSWDPANTGIAGQDQFITSLVAQPDSTTFYAGTSTGKVYSTISGNNWSLISGTSLPANPVTALVIELAEPINIYAAINGSGVYVSSDGGVNWLSMSTGLNSSNVLGLVLDATHTPHTLYAATLGRGTYDFQISFATAPIVFIGSPTSPTSTTSPVQVTGTVVPTTVSKVLWSTSRGHAGQATGTSSWSASIPLELGSNVITITAVDPNSHEGSQFLTVEFTPPPNPPTVTITTPTPNPTFATTTTPLALGGTSSDDTAVISVTWANSLGGSGTATGTTSWAASIPLQQGSNVITVTAHDAHGGIGTDVITVSFGTFADVPASHMFFTFIEALFDAALTGGCSTTTPPLYCPDAGVFRDQMALFLLRGIHGAGYQPPDATGTMFTDVPLSQPFAKWIEQLAREGITAGCSTTPPMYCPGSGVTRGQMALFLLLSKHGAGYQPPAATGTMFTDVPETHPFAKWIEQLAREGITAGCSPTTFCPNVTATRGQMAVFLVRTFDLPM